MDDVIKETTLLASFEDGDFTTVGPFPHPVQKSIMPVVAVRGTEIRPIGSCFAISNSGLLITAKHVIDEALGFTGRNKLEHGPTYPDCWLQVIYASDEHNEDGSLVGGPLHVNKVHYSASLDIAVLHAQLPFNVKTGKTLQMPPSLLSPGIPMKGQRCYGVGYHAMNWMPKEQGYEVIQSFSASQGVIEEIYFPQRESSRLNFPCFRSTARFDAGMSGGPIIGQDGGVIGVVCDDCHGSLIGPAFLIPVVFRTDEDQETTKFLYAAVEGGSVPVDQTIDQIGVEQNDLEIVLNFGHPVRLRNVLH